MTNTSASDEAAEHALFEEFESKADRLGQHKWTLLQEAREYVTKHLVGRPPSTDDEWADTHCVEGFRPERLPATEFGRRYVVADAASRRFLTRVLASGELNARGILHIPSSPSLQPEMLEPLPVIWWHRVVDRHNRFAFAFDNLHMHCVTWIIGMITRFRSVKGTELGAWLPLLKEEWAAAVVTNIEVDRLKLLELVPPVGNTEAAALPERRRGRRPDDARISTITDVAKQVIGDQFGSVEAFAKKVADQYSTKDQAGIDPKQVRRWIFGEL